MSSRIAWNYELVKNFINNLGYDLLSEEYITSRDKLKIRCNKGHVFNIAFRSFKNSKKCPICEGRILTYDIVKEYINSIGYTLLSEEYLNVHHELEIKCKCGHIFKMKFSNIKSGQRCPKCAGVEKHTYSYVKSYVESKGYELLSKKYINNSSKLRMRCSKGHVFSTAFANFTKNKNCPKCIGKGWSYEEVKEYINSFNYKLLSDQYITANKKLKLKCPNNHIFDMTFTKFKQGQRCRKCYENNAGDKFKHSYEYVKNYVESNGYILLSEDYLGNKSKLKLKCSNGHTINMTFDSFKRGCRCRECYDSIIAGNQFRHTYEYVKEFIESENYKLLSSEYLNQNKKLKLKCPNNHIFTVSFGKFKQGQRCHTCNPSSKGELKISQILNKFNIKYNEQYRFNDCKFYNTLPFDFYLPKYNCCIEYDGIQHYKIIDYFGGFDGFINTKIRDTIKDIYCKNNNIKLIRIPYKSYNDIETILIKELKIS